MSGLKAPGSEEPLLAKTDLPTAETTHVGFAVNALPLHHRIGVQIELSRGTPISDALRNVVGGILVDKK